MRQILLSITALAGVVLVVIAVGFEGLVASEPDAESTMKQTLHCMATGEVTHTQPTGRSPSGIEPTCRRNHWRDPRAGLHVSGRRQGRESNTAGQSDYPTKRQEHGR